jgi:probable F420-dependent oxidoreductase
MGHDERFDELLDGLERLGFDSLWLSERISAPIHDPLMGLAYAAGRTRRLKLGTSVLVLPGRNPALLAKELASLDRLSDGRLLPAFGLGLVDPVEQQAFGVDRRERTPLLEEVMPLLRRLWEEEAVDHEGPRYTYRGLSIRPKPIQQPLDLWLGGFGPATLRRIGRLADGWLPSQITPAESASGRAEIERAAAEAGREVDPEHFGAILVYVRDRIPPSLIETIAARRPGVDPSTLVAVGLDGLRARLKQFIEAGASKFVVRPAEEPASWTAELEELAEAVLPLQG